MYRVRRFSQTRKRSKYSNQFTDTGGQKYHSKLEAKVAQDLEWRRKAGEIISWVKQEKIRLVVNGYKIADYWIDFTCIRSDGRKEYIEVKGLELPLGMLKFRLLEAILSKEEPDSILTMVKR